MHYAHALRARRSRALAISAVLFMSSTLAHAAAPKISGTPATSVVVGANYSFTPVASDADHDKLTFSVTNKPGWASFSSTTGQLWGTPFAEHARTWSNVVISVSDGASKVSLPTFSVVVKPNPNKSPTISGSPPTTATVGQAYAFTPTAKDPEGKALTFSIRNKPSWATFSTTTGKLSGTPTAAGTFASIMFIVSDGVSSASLPSFSIAVSGSSSGSNTAPTITGSPSASGTVGQAYAFTPTATDANGDALTFKISGQPSWATFSTSTGKLSGTPSTAGASGSIVISVTDGKATTSLPAFAINVSSPSSGGSTGAATLSWTPPTRNTDGSTLTNLAGYRISYGTSASSLTKTITLSNPGIANHVVENLAAGTWYFAIKAYTSSGSESALSSVASKSVR